MALSLNKGGFKMKGNKIKLNKRKGTFLVELAIILPIFVLLLSWIFMLGMILHRKQVVTLAARAGAQYAVYPDPVYSERMAKMGVWMALSQGKRDEVEKRVKDVLKRNGLNPDKAKINIDWFPVPFVPPFKEGSVQNPGQNGRATVHALYTDMLGGNNCETRCHSGLVRQELKREFDDVPRYRYTEYRIPCDIWVVRVRVEYPLGESILNLLNPIFRSVGFRGDLKQGKAIASCAFPAPMPFVHVVSKTPPLFKALFDISTYFK